MRCKFSLWGSDVTAFLSLKSLFDGRVVAGTSWTLAAILFLMAPVSTFGQDWQAGFARKDITPPDGIWMAGYASRKSPAEGTQQKLFAKVVVLQDRQEHRLALVTLDLIGVPRSLREDLASQVERATGIPPQHLFLNASHTHCGPELRPPLDPETPSAVERTAQAREYSRQLQETLLGLVKTAVEDLKPSRLAYSSARCGFAMNRRLPTASGYQNSPFPDGPVDHQVPVLRIESLDGKSLRGLLFGYACHNTTLSFNRFCADYAGYAQEALEERHPGCQAMFVLGCGGDQNPYPRGQLELCQQHGRTLALAVEAALLPEPVALSGRLKGAMTTVDLPFATIPTREEFTAIAAGKNALEAQHAKRMLRLLDQGESLGTSYPYLVQTLRLGDQLTLVGLSGEVVVDYSLRLQRELSERVKKGAIKPAFWIAGYSNDVFGYVPSARLLAEGGYEPVSSMLYTLRPAPFASSLEDAIVEAVQKLVRETNENE